MTESLALPLEGPWATETLAARLDVLRRQSPTAPAPQADAIHPIRDAVTQFVRRRDGAVRDTLVNKPALFFLTGGSVTQPPSLAELRTLGVTPLQLTTPVPDGCGLTLRALVETGAIPTIEALCSLGLCLDDVLLLPRGDGARELAPRALADAFGEGALRRALGEQEALHGFGPVRFLRCARTLRPLDLEAMGVNLGQWLQDERFAARFAALAPAILTTGPPHAWAAIGVTSGHLRKALKLGSGAVTQAATKVAGWQPNDVAKAFGTVGPLIRPSPVSSSRAQQQ